MNKTSGRSFWNKKNLSERFYASKQPQQSGSLTPSVWVLSTPIVVSPQLSHFNIFAFNGATFESFPRRAQNAATKQTRTVNERFWCSFFSNCSYALALYNTVTLQLRKSALLPEIGIKAHYILLQTLDCHSGRNWVWWATDEHVMKNSQLQEVSNQTGGLLPHAFDVAGFGSAATSKANISTSSRYLTVLWQKQRSSTRNFKCLTVNTCEREV